MFRSQPILLSLVKTWQLPVIYYIHDDGKTYRLVDEIAVGLQDRLPNIVKTALYSGILVDTGESFLFPVSLENTPETEAINQSLKNTVNLAKEQVVHLSFDVEKGEFTYEDGNYPSHNSRAEYKLDFLVECAFVGQTIKDADHPILKRLLGGDAM